MSDRPEWARDAAAEMDAVERKRADEWAAKHLVECRHPKLYVITHHTGIGSTFNVVCEYCKWNVSVTDYDSW